MGAFAPLVPVQPVVVRYNLGLAAARGRGAANADFDVSMVKHGPGGGMLLWRMLCQPANQLEVEFLPAMAPLPEDGGSPARFAERVRVVRGRAAARCAAAPRCR